MLNYINLLYVKPKFYVPARYCDTRRHIDGLVFNFSGGNNVTTPMVSLKDNYSLGFVKLSTYEWASAVRLTNGIPYLNRNFTITVDNNPNGSGNIPMRFYIPQAMFDALKTADPVSAVRETSALSTSPARTVLRRQPIRRLAMNKRFP